MSTLLLIIGLLLAPLAAPPRTVIDVYPDTTLVTVTTPPGHTALACYSDPLVLLPPICSLPDAIKGLPLGDVEVYDVDGRRVKAVLQITMDENGQPLEQYFTPDNSAGSPTPQPLRLAITRFSCAGEADYFAAGVEFHLFDYPYNSGHGRPPDDCRLSEPRDELP